MQLLANDGSYKCLFYLHLNHKQMLNYNTIKFVFIMFNYYFNDIIYDENNTNLFVTIVFILYAFMNKIVQMHILIIL